MPRSMLYLFGLFGCILASTLVNCQTTADYVITSINIPPGGTIVAGTSFISSVYATVSGSFNYSEHSGSYELMAGAKNATNSAVVDLMFWNEPLDMFSVEYYFPANLPPGPYHFRVNITNDTGISTLSDTFQVTAPVFDCLKPPPWKNISSASDPNYRSFVVESPQAGEVTPLGFNLGGLVEVIWDYKDFRNSADNDVNDIRFDFVNANTGQATGLYIVAQESLRLINFSFAGSNLWPGPWRIRANYLNPFEGANGATVTYLSEVIYFSGDKSTCDGIGRSNSGAGSGRFWSSSSGWKLVMGLTGFVFLVWSV